MIWDIDPVALSVFGLDIRWYGLGYITAYFIVRYWGWYLIKKSADFSEKHWDDLLFGMFFVGILGGRLGEFLFYSPSTFITDPLEVLKIWHGGMSIHGGMLGGLGFAWWFCRKNKINLFDITDHIVIPLSFGLGIGRITNYINGELVGIPTNTDWGVIFPHVDQILRHPSQLYEAGSMFLLAGLLWIMWKICAKKIRGFFTAYFFLGYGMFRFIVEFWKDQPAVLHDLKTGQILCLLMILFGILFLLKPHKQ